MDENKRDVAFRVVVTTSLVYLSFLLFAAYHLGFVEVSCWSGAKGGQCLTATDWATLLAGVFSPLAFAWFAYTAKMQSDELRMQRRELQLNTRSQEDQARALNAQVAQLNAQADAAYQPVLVLTNITPHNDLVSGGKKHHLEIFNRTRVVLDVTAGNRPIVQFKPDEGNTTWRSVPGHTLAYFPVNSGIRIEIPQLADGSDRFFEVTYTRLDSVRRTQRYEVIADETRLRLVPETQN